MHSLAAILARRLVLWGLVAWLLAMPPQAGAGEGAPSADRARQRHVLLLYTESRLLPALVAADQAIRSTLEAGSPGRIFFYTEYLDTSLFVGDAPANEVRQLLRSRFDQKYPPGRLDLVIAGGMRALRIALRNRAELFASVPLVFIAEQSERLVDPPPDTDVTGVWASLPWAETLDLGLRLQPATRRVVVVAGTASVDSDWLTQARAQLAPYATRLQIEYLTNLTLEEVLDRVSTLPPETILLPGSFLRDTTGRDFIGAQVIGRIAAAARVPTYALSATAIGTGIVGGSVVDWDALGQQAGSLALRVLRGERPPAAGPAANVHVIDWRQLRRWGLDERRLPPGTLVRFRELSAWDLYKWHIIGVLALVAGQSVILGGLLVQRRQRQRVQRALAERLRFETLLSELSAALVNPKASDVDHEISQGLRRMVETLQLDRATLAEVAPTRDSIRVTHRWTRDGAAPIPETVERREFPWMTSRLLEGHLVCLSRIEDLPGEAAVDGRSLATLGVRSLAVVPLTVEGSVVGTLSFATLDEARSWPDELIQRLRLLGEIFASTLARRQAERGAKRAEQELRASEDRYRDLVEHSEDLICTHDLEGRILSCNPAPARLLGYDVDTLCGMTVRDILAPEVRAEFDEYLRVVQRDGGAAGRVKVVARTGERRVWAFRNTLRTEGVATPIVRGMAHDVTDQLRAERALRLSEAKLATVFRASPCALVLMSLDGQFLDVNETFEAVSGYSRAEVLGRTSLELGLWGTPDERARVRAALLRDGRLKEREVRFRHKSGRLVDVLFSAEIVPVGGEPTVLMAGIGVTARKEAERRQQAILKALPDWVFLTDIDGVFLDCHSEVDRHLSSARGEILGRKIVDVLPADLALRLRGAFEEAGRSTRTVAFEYSLSTDGGRRFYDVRVVACGDHVLSLIRDVTDRQRAEHRARELHNELVHAGRVMALGTLTGAIVHEINQPLTAIRTNAHVVLRLLEAPPPEPGSLREVMLDIVSDLRRVDAILGRLRQLLRKERREDAPVDLNALVEDVVKLVRGEFLRRRIALDVEPTPGLPPVLGDPIQLQQVVLNILMNAAEAVGADGDVGEQTVRLTTAATGSRVVVSVVDRGPGVPDEELTRIFEPFVTTKGRGLGLGLAICRRIMDAHGGEIGVRRNVDRGLTCWFALEAASAATGRVDGDATGAER